MRNADAAEELSILLIDDDGDDRALVVRQLRRELPEARVIEVSDAVSLTRALEGEAVQLAITDYQLHWTDGLAVLRALKSRWPLCPVIMFTGTGSEEVVVEAMKAGLDDYVLKSPKHRARLSPAVRSALERARERRDAAEAEERLRALEKAVETLPLGVTITATNGRILYTNPAEPRMHGYAPGELLGKEARILVPSAFWKPLTPEQLRGVRAWKRERINVRKDGTTFPAQLISDVVRNAAGEPIAIVTTCEDITERKEAEEQLRRHALYDALTGLANRALFMDRLARAVDAARRSPEHAFGVLFLDLDRFKLVNDSLGHFLGDQMLREVARRLEVCVRPGDTVARFGGDEFAVLLVDVKSVVAATHVAERVQTALAAPVRVNGHDVFTSASIGIALSAVHYRRPEDVLRDADAAMYRAKALGKARYEVFDEGMHARAAAILSLEADLRRAVDRGEFVLHFQPIVSLATGRATGAEALLRWRHPGRGLLLPEEFIAVAEETGVIVPIGEWVLRAACDRLRSWRSEGRDRELSVNLSARQFRQRGLAALVSRALRETEQDPALLRLELTESALMDDTGAALATVRELKDLGVEVSIDDFGTGFSSLSHLKRFPIDELKIDRSFVLSLPGSRADAAIATSVISLAHNMGLGVVGEGVETPEQLAYLRAQGCDAVQGFLVGVPAADLAA